MAMEKRLHCCHRIAMGAEGAGGCADGHAKAVSCLAFGGFSVRACHGYSLRVQVAGGSHLLLTSRTPPISPRGIDDSSLDR